MIVKIPTCFGKSLALSLAVVLEEDEEIQKTGKVGFVVGCESEM